MPEPGDHQPQSPMREPRNRRWFLRGVGFTAATGALAAVGLTQAKPAHADTCEDDCYNTYYDCYGVCNRNWDDCLNSSTDPATCEAEANTCYNRCDGALSFCLDDCNSCGCSAAPAVHSRRAHKAIRLKAASAQQKAK
jgi:hypothetical protein